MKGRKGAALAAVLGGAAVGAAVVAAPATVGAVERVTFATKAANADQVGGWKVSQEPTPNSLVPLNGSGKLPAGAMNYRLAPGQTVTGAFGATFATVAAAGADQRCRGRLPELLTARLAITDVGIQGGGIELPECEGSYDVPTAPPGKLCLYPGPEGDVTPRRTPEVVNVRKNGEGAFEAYVYPDRPQAGLPRRVAGQRRRRHPPLRRLGLHAARPLGRDPGPVDTTNPSRRRSMRTRTTFLTALAVGGRARRVRPGRRRGAAQRRRLDGPAVLAQKLAIQFEKSHARASRSAASRAAARVPASATPTAACSTSAPRRATRRAPTRPA